MRRNVYSVGQVNAYIKNMFAQDFMLRQISVSGEISNCKYHSSGHIYFTLKDSSGIIQAVMFAGNRRGLTFHMKEGDNVVVTGSIEVYERDGKYQLYAREITLAGAGDLYLKYEALKKELEEMGMFAKEYKQDIPKYAKTIGIVTAPTGAAVRDINNIAQRRNPYVQLILYPALVQGQDAKFSIVNGIRTLDSMGLDVLIVGRGGGSMEDLWAFNEEIVARAIFECETPVISAVGHETDVTIADYVADLRAPTPSAAAELAVFDYRQFENRLEVLREALNRGVERNLERKKAQVEQYQMKLKLHHPERILNDHRQRLVQIQDQMERRIEERLTDRKHRLALLAGRLHGLSPLEQLSRGVGFVTDKDGKPVASVRELQKEESLQIRLADGRVETRILKIEGLEPDSGELEEETYGGN